MNPETSPHDTGQDTGTGYRKYLELASSHAHWIIILLFFIIGASTIITFPPVHYLGDELGMMSTGGNFVDELLKGDLPGHITPRFFYAALWGVGKVAGVGVVQYRALSLACSVLVLWLVFVLARELGGRATGLLALLVVTGDYTFAWNARLIRPEMMSTLFVFASFTALVFASRENIRHKGLLAFGAALLVALSINVHPNNLQYVAGMTLLYPVLFWRGLRSRQTVMFAAGLLAGFAFWMLWSFLPSQTTLAGSPAAGAATGLSRVWAFPFLSENFFTLFAGALKGFGRDYIVEYLTMADTIFPNHVTFAYYASLIAIGVSLAMFTDRRRAALLLVGFPAGVLFLNYFLTNKFGYWHMVEVHPYLSIAAALGVCSVSLKLPAKLRPVAIAVFVVCLPLTGYWDQARSIRAFSIQHDYSLLLQSVSAPVPEAGGPVMGHILYSPGFGDRYRPLGYDVEHAKGPLDRCRPLWQRVGKEGAGYFIMDDILRGMMVSACGKMYFKDSLRWLSLNGRLISHVNQSYPNFWAPGRMQRDAYVYEILAREDG
ncbi:MAG: glycosyltransferase family 39 protein [Thermodesulfovibrionales bacterium]|nr:glycosyltransferase family 39 protein [Thermodesulfovibrionales bacterium]